MSVTNLSISGNKFLINGVHTKLVGDSLTQGWQWSGDDFDYVTYTHTLKDVGANATLLWLFTGHPGNNDVNRLNYSFTPYWPWSKTGSIFNLDVFNQTYFDKLKLFIEEADSQGVVVVLTVFDGWVKSFFSTGHPFNKTFGGPLTTGEEFVLLSNYGSEVIQGTKPTSSSGLNQWYLEKFAEKLIQETSSYTNIIYEIFNEGEWYASRANWTAFNTHFAKFFKDRAPQRLVAINYDWNGDTLDGHSGDFWNDFNVDIISHHKPDWDKPALYTGTTLSKLVFDHYNADLKTKPVLFTEPVPSLGYSRYNTANQLLNAKLMAGNLLGGSNVLLQNDLSWLFNSNGLPVTISSAGQTVIDEYFAARDSIYDMIGFISLFYKNKVKNLNSLVSDSSITPGSICQYVHGEEYIVFNEASTLPITINNLPVGSYIGVFLDPINKLYTTYTQHTSTGGNLTVNKPTASSYIFHLLKGILPTKNPVVVLSDPLTNSSTVGTKVGGTYTADGYQPGIGSNHIFYEVNTIKNGSLEFQMKGFNHTTIVGTDIDNGFVGMYDGRLNGSPNSYSEPIDYYNEFKYNYFRWNFHWRQGYNSGQGCFKSVIQCAKPNKPLNTEGPSESLGNAMYTVTPLPYIHMIRDWAAEPNGSVFTWNSSTWYTVKIEWYNKQFTVTVNNVIVWSVGGLYDYAPGIHRIWVGCAPNNGTDKYLNKNPNTIFKNVILTDYQLDDTIILPDNLELSSSIINLSPNIGASSSFNILSNISWEITNIPAWISLSQTTGTGNATIVATAISANTNTENRSQIITIGKV